MVLYIYLFDRQWAGHADNICTCLMQPFSWSCQRLMSLFKLTTKEVTLQEEAPCYERYVIVSLYVPILILAVAFTAPLAFFAFCFWMPLQKQRHPFRYSCQNTSKEVPSWKEGDAPDRIIRVASVDTSLLSEYDARCLNLQDTPTRANLICDAIIQSQASVPPAAIGTSKKSVLNRKAVDHEEIMMAQFSDRPLINNQLLYEDQDLDLSGESFAHSVLTEFSPQTAVFCLQGIFNGAVQKQMSQRLHQAYPHIVCDVTVNSWRENQYMDGSGLITASKYPVTDASFKHFTHAAADDRKRCKGALFVKIEIGSSSEGKKLVGFVLNTHLQDGGFGFAGVRCRQLNELHQWRREFRQDTLVEGEVVAFEVLCGELGFDNMSTADRENWSNQLIQEYKDPCRNYPGSDKDWVIGTDLVTSKIHDADVSSPTGLKSILLGSDTVEEYVSRIVVEGGRDLETGMSDGGVGKAKRRLNYILLKKESEDSAFENVLYEFMYITRLATVSKKLPICCSFVLRSAKQ